MAWLEKRGSKYVICDRDGGGNRVRIPAYTDKLASKQKLAKYELAKSRGEQGMLDPFEQHKHRPITAHVAEYIADLKALGRDQKYVYNCDKRLSKLIKLCGWKVLRDITADSFGFWREKPIKQKGSESSDGTIGPRTQNQYLEVLRTFCGWSVKRKRTGANPVADVEKVEETGDVRRARRALTPEQIATLLKAVARVHQAVYRFILATGLRRQEVEDLLWGDVRLSSPTPFIQLRAKATKSRRADSIPLRSDLAAELKTMRGDAGDDQHVFASVPTMDEHRAYLTTAGIDWKDSEGRRADVHALRHTYGTLLSQSGTSPREAMELMRHTDLSLTMKVYTDPRLFDLAGAVERLPIPSASTPTAAVATGTDGAVVVSNRCEKLGAQMGATSTIEGHSTAVTGKGPSKSGRSETLDITGDSQPLAPIGNDGRGEEKNSPKAILFISSLC
jgi:integrase